MIDAEQVKIHRLEGIKSYPESNRSKLHLCDSVYPVVAAVAVHVRHTAEVMSELDYGLVQTRAIVPYEELNMVREFMDELNTTSDELYSYPAAVIPFRNPGDGINYALLYLQTFQEGRHGIDKYNLHDFANLQLAGISSKPNKIYNLNNDIYSIHCVLNDGGQMMDCLTGNQIIPTTELAETIANLYKTEFGTLHYAGLINPDYHFESLTAGNPFYMILDRSNNSVAAFAQLERDTNITFADIPFYEGTWLTRIDYRKRGLSSQLRLFMAEQNINNGIIYTESRWNDSLPASLLSGWNLGSRPVYDNSGNILSNLITANLGPYVAVANNNTQMGVTYVAGNELRIR